MAIYEWNVTAGGDGQLLELNLVSSRRRGEVTIRSAQPGTATLVDEGEIRVFLDSFERVSLRRAGAARPGDLSGASVAAPVGNTLGGTRVIV